MRGVGVPVPVERRMYKGATVPEAIYTAAWYEITG